jgi:hypothetical protein
MLLQPFVAFAQSPNGLFKLHDADIDPLSLLVMCASTLPNCVVQS